MKLGKYSFGIGDRFGQQGEPLLAAIIEAGRLGVEVTPVWNKSYREHSIIGTRPEAVRAEARDAANSIMWEGVYFVDADHINLKNVDAFMKASDFFTLDVADFIGRGVPREEIDIFIDRSAKYVDGLTIPGIKGNLAVGEDLVRQIAGKYLAAIKEAGKLYRHIVAKKGVGNFVTELSIDEADQAQSPVELFFILAGVSQEEIPIQTIAPKFSGRFNKGVDYAGNVEEFTKEFEQSLGAIALAKREFGLPADLKISVHSGSDKFSIYKSMNKALKKFNAGLHIKTSGTTWLEEIIGLAIAGGEGLSIAKQIYAAALSRFDELCGPYSAVVDIDKGKLPPAEAVGRWSGAELADTLRNEPSCDKYNPNFRQLLHVAYKIAAEMGIDYLNVLEKYERIISQNVMKNIYERHIKPIFMG
ncbi:MAG: tagaturonate epimerase family protein [Sedimentisphaerales bacterium]|nr:tagaturonate epimerase family protein [Sedimentisphaerales bacterium]